MVISYGSLVVNLLSGFSGMHDLNPFQFDVTVEANQHQWCNTENGGPWPNFRSASQGDHAAYRSLAPRGPLKAHIPLGPLAMLALCHGSSCLFYIIYLHPSLPHRPSVSLSLSLYQSLSLSFPPFPLSLSLSSSLFFPSSFFPLLFFCRAGP